MPETKFLRIRCPRCGKQHLTFGKASTPVKCKSCNKLLVKLTGGKVRIKAAIEEVLW